MHIKNSCKAIITDNNKILLNTAFAADGSKYYILPGGGQNAGESMPEAVVRECLEETGYTVSVQKLAAVGERVCGGLHKIYHVFLCKLANDIKANPTNTDVNQSGCEWVELSDNIALYPIFIKAHFRDIIKGRSVIDLGAEKDSVPVIDRGHITVKYLQAYIKSKDHAVGAEDKYFIKLIEEAGELARQIVREPRRAESTNIKDTLEEELWDVIYYAVVLANLYGIDLEKWIPVKEELNNKRFHQGFKFDPDEWNLKQ